MNETVCHIQKGKEGLIGPEPVNFSNELLKAFLA